MKLEDILPQIRAGRKARRKGWTPPFNVQVDRDSGLHYLTRTDILTDDWELVPEPVRVAVYLVEVKHSAHVITKIWENESVKMKSVPYFIKQTHPIGQQPEGSVKVPGSEREVSE